MKFRFQKLENGNCNSQNLKTTIPISSAFDYIPTGIILGLTCLIYIMSTCVLVLAGIAASVIVILWTFILLAIPAHIYLLLPGYQPDEKQIINHIGCIPSIGCNACPVH